MMAESGGTCRFPARLRGLAAVLTAASVLAGCAVLTVDVDVYKGPLANDHDVQIEQMAVMTVKTPRFPKRIRNPRFSRNLSMK